MPESHQDDNPLNLVLLLRDYVLKQDFERGMHEMREDLSELKKDVKNMREIDLKDLQKAIVSKQNEGYKRIIAIQAAILSPVAVTLVIYIIQRFF